MKPRKQLNEFCNKFEEQRTRVNSENIFIKLRMWSDLEGTKLSDIINGKQFHTEKCFLINCSADIEHEILT